MNFGEPLTNRAEPLLLAWGKKLASGEINEAEWYRKIAAEITPAYLSSDNPRGQSGFIGDEAHQERREIVGSGNRNALTGRQPVSESQGSTLGVRWNPTLPNHR
jgi:hypothetical protein